MVSDPVRVSEASVAPASQRGSVNEPGVVAVTGLRTFAGRGVVQRLLARSAPPRIVGLDWRRPFGLDERVCFQRIDLTEPTADCRVAESGDGMRRISDTNLPIASATAAVSDPALPTFMNTSKGSSPPLTLIVMYAVPRGVSIFRVRPVNSAGRGLILAGIAVAGGVLLSRAALVSRTAFSREPST